MVIFVRVLWWNVIFSITGGYWFESPLHAFFFNVLLKMYFVMSYHVFALSMCMDYISVM